MAYADPSSPTTTSRSFSHKRRSMRQSLSTLRSSDNSTYTLPTVYTDITTPPRKSTSRPSSQASFRDRVLSPSSPALPYSPTYTLDRRRPSSRFSIGSTISLVPSDSGVNHVVLSNLADELDEAIYEDEDVRPNDYTLDLSGLQAGNVRDSFLDSTDHHSPTNQYETPLQSPRRLRHSRHTSLQPPGSTSPSKQWTSLSVRRRPESLYDGSDYGPNDDEDGSEPTFTPVLQRRIHDLEETTRLSAFQDNLDLPTAGAIDGVMDRLRRGLGDQSMIEYSSTRLATMYMSTAGSRIHQAQELQSLVNTLNSSNYAVGNGGFLSIPPEVLEGIVAEIERLVVATQDTQPLSILAARSEHDMLLSLQSFHYNTLELLRLLHNLTDTLTESKQALNDASRRLRSVKGLVEGLVMEEELVQTSMLLLQAGDWDRRCRDRQAAKICREMLDGANTQCQRFDTYWNSIDCVDVNA